MMTPIAITLTAKIILKVDQDCLNPKSKNLILCREAHCYLDT